MPDRGDGCKGNVAAGGVTGAGACGPSLASSANMSPKMSAEVSLNGSSALAATAVGPAGPRCTSMRARFRNESTSTGLRNDASASGNASGGSIGSSRTTARLALLRPEKLRMRSPAPSVAEPTTMRSGRGTDRSAASLSGAARTSQPSAVKAARTRSTVAPSRSTIKQDGIRASPPFDGRSLWHSQLGQSNGRR